MEDFKQTVYNAIRLIPKGKVTTYKEIAKYIKKPKAYRAVGNALHKNPKPIIQPCHRVVNAKGELAKSFGFGGASGQAKLLTAENVEVNDNKVNLKRYLYKF